MSELHLLTATELRHAYATGELDPGEVLAAHRERIGELEVLNAWLSVWPESAPSAQGRLAGIGVAVKDNFDTAGARTTYASQVHRDHVPDVDATAVTRLREAGATILGKTHLHEYALGVTNENAFHGDCLNPHDHERTPGGSSGGSAVAVATGMACVALGSDTSGSIRIPAAACGVVGLKPTYGRVGKSGCFPEAWSLDHVGPLTRSVADAALMLDVLSGHDPTDPASLPLPPTELASLEIPEDLQGVRVGIEQDFFLADVDPRVRQVTDQAIARLVDLGAELIEVSLPTLTDAIWALTIIDTAETAAAHRTLMRTHRDDYGDDVRVLIECGELPSAVDYLQAQQVRTLVQRDFARVFGQVDALVSPTLSILPPKRGQATVPVAGQDRETSAELMRLIGPANLAGLPALSLPAGVIEEDGASLPTGLHLMAAPRREDQLIMIGGALEASLAGQLGERRV
ncbi:amidase [Propionibacteriaceae bacterium Y1685]